MNENFEEKPPASAPEIQTEATERKVIESREGEKYFAERLVNPEDPKVERFQEMLENNFGKKEVDPLEVTKEAIKDDPPYLIHVVENSKGEIKGLNASAVIETVDAEGEASKKSASWFDCYTLMSPDARGQGLAKKVFESQHESAIKDAESRGTEIKSWVAETHNAAEGFFESVGMRRVYSRDKGGVMREVAYSQMPLNWDEKTGKPAEGAGPVPEHLMVKMTSGENKISAKDFQEMVRGVHYYSSYWDKEDFKTQEAYDNHVKYLEKAEEEFFKSIGKKDLHLLSVAERAEMSGKGIKFVEHKIEEDDKEVAENQMSKNRKGLPADFVLPEKRGHIRTPEEIKAARDSLAPDKRLEDLDRQKQREADWHEMFYKMGGARGKERIEAAERELAQEKKAVESAKIPKDGIKTKEVLKEAGSQKPAESYKEVQERLAERLDGRRTFEGKKLSEADKFVETRKFYLEELGYSVKYKGVLLDKAEILDENGKSILNDKGKALEFKSFYFSKTEAQINDFLKGRLQEKLDGKPVEKLSEEQKLEKGYQKAIKGAENAQADRETKISFLQGVKAFGREKWGKLAEGITRLNLREGWGIGLKEGKRLAIEGGKDLAVIGLTPLAAMEEAGKRIRGESQLGAAMREKRLKEERIQQFEQMPRFKEYVEFLKRESRQVDEKWGRSYGSLYKKGKILKLIEEMSGRLSRPVAEKLSYE